MADSVNLLPVYILFFIILLKLSFYKFCLKELSVFGGIKQRKGGIASLAWHKVKENQSHHK